MTNLTMFDSTAVADIPSVGMDAVLGYTGGRWPTYAALKGRFPHLTVLGVAIRSSDDGHGLDVEKGDATPADVPGWLDRHNHAVWGTPFIYCSASNVNAVRRAAGSRRYLLVSAHYGAGPHICGPKTCRYPQVDATQWDDHGPHGEHYDRTLMTPSFLAAYAPPVPKTPIIKRIVQRIVPVRHRTGEATEKPWGAIPLPRGEWYGLDDGTPRSHSGKNPADHRAIKQIQREVGVAADGDYGPVTAWHVAAYQRRRKVYPADGATGVETWDDMATHD